VRAAYMGGRRVLCLPLFVFLLSSVKTSISFELRRKATVSGLCFLFADNGHFFINSLDKQKSHHTITPNVSYQNKHFHSNSWARNHLQDLAHGTASTKTTYSSTSFPRGLVNISLSQPQWREQITYISDSMLKMFHLRAPTSVLKDVSTYAANTTYNFKITTHF